MAQIVQVGIDAVAHEPAVAGQRRRLVGNGGLDPAAHVGQLVELAAQAADERRLAVLQQQRRARHHRERRAQAGEVARAGRGQRDARHHALEILDALERVAHLGPIGRADGEFLHRVQPIANALQHHQRTEQPGAQQPAAHRGDRAIDLMEQRALAAAVHRLDHLQVLQRGRIDQQRVAGVLQPDAADVRELGFLRIPQVTHQRAGRGHRGGAAFEPEAVEAAHAQLVEQRLPGALEIEVPAVHLGDRQFEARDLRDLGLHVVAAGDDNLARTQHRDFILQRLQALWPVVLGDVELTGREVEQGHAVFHGLVVRAGDGRDRHQERRLAGVEVAGVGQRPGRDHPHDLALDHALGLLRVLHLLADGHPIALLDQPRDEAVRGVVGEPAHRHGRAAGVLRSRRQGEVQGAGRHQRVLVEHLVEIAHPEEHDGVAILPLRLEILAHRGRDIRAGRHGKGVRI